MNWLAGIAIMLLIAGCTLPKQAVPVEKTDIGGETQAVSEEPVPENAGGEAVPELNVDTMQDSPATAGGPMAARPRGTLFLDDFSEGFTDQWEYEFNAPEEESTGNPAPSLKLPARIQFAQTSSAGEGGPRMGGVQIGKNTDVKITTAVEPFSVINGLSISFEIKVPEAPENSLGPFYVSLREQDETYPNAAFTISSNQLSYNTRIPYSSTRDDRARSATGPMIRDTKWHKFELSIDADGTAKWKKDGVTKLTGYIVPGDYLLEIRSSPAIVTETQPYYYLLDNVLVRSLEQAPVRQTSTQGTTTTTQATTTSGKGTLSVSGDNGYLYLGQSYIGQGRAVVSVSAGSYTLTSVSPSTGDVCWQRGIRIDGGKTTTVKIDSWCR